MTCLPSFSLSFLRANVDAIGIDLDTHADTLIHSLRQNEMRKMSWEKKKKKKKKKKNKKKKKKKEGRKRKRGTGGRKGELFGASVIFNDLWQTEFGFGWA